VAESYAYRAFGQQYQKGAVAQPYTFVGRPGYQRDSEVDLYFVRARYYDFAAGRWVSRDPIGLAGGDPNLYRYVANDPVNRADPGGLQDLPANVMGPPKPSTPLDWINTWLRGAQQARSYLEANQRNAQWLEENIAIAIEWQKYLEAAAEKEGGLMTVTRAELQEALSRTYRQRIAPVLEEQRRQQQEAAWSAAREKQSREFKELKHLLDRGRHRSSDQIRKDVRNAAEKRITVLHEYIEGAEILMKGRKEEDKSDDAIRLRKYYSTLLQERSLVEGIIEGRYHLGAADDLEVLRVEELLEGYRAAAKAWFEYSNRNVLKISADPRTPDQIARDDFERKLIETVTSRDPKITEGARYLASIDLRRLHGESEWSIMFSSGGTFETLVLFPLGGFAAPSGAGSRQAFAEMVAIERASRAGVRPPEGDWGNVDPSELLRSRAPAGIGNAFDAPARGRHLWMDPTEQGFGRAWTTVERYGLDRANAQARLSRALTDIELVEVSEFMRQEVSQRVFQRIGGAADDIIVEVRVGYQRQDGGFSVRGVRPPEGYRLIESTHSHPSAARGSNVYPSQRDALRASQQGVPERIISRNGRTGEIEVGGAPANEPGWGR
jgi:RHS repeat-associated protein